MKGILNINQQSNNTALTSLKSTSDRKTNHAQTGFDDLGMIPSLLKAINRLKFEKPTPIQMEAIPVGIQGEDLIALAQTGSGKTLAFGIPMLQRLSKNKSGTGLVLVPTRELAIQVEESLQPLSKPLNIRSAVLIGGASMIMQRNILKKNPRIIIATPGRLMDHLERGTVNLSKLEIFILDEADRMLDMGFVPDIKKIMLSIPENRQTMLFSATMPKPIEKIAQQLMDNPVHIETDNVGSAPVEVSQEIFMLNNLDKGRLLAYHIKECTGPVLVFTRTKRMATKLSSKILDMGFSAAEIHSDRSQGQRRNALEGFKRGRYQVLIATDIAARGIDVTGIELVVNYDMPANTEDYIHRIGRTGRAGKKGHAISFATSSQKGEIRDIERALKRKMPISKLPTSLPSEKELFKDAAHLNLKEILTDNNQRQRSNLTKDSRPLRSDSNKRFSKDKPTFERERPQRLSRSDKPEKRREFFTADITKKAKYKYEDSSDKPVKKRTSDEKPFRKFSKDNSASGDKPYRMFSKDNSSASERPARKFSKENSTSGEKPFRKFSKENSTKRKDIYKKKSSAPDSNKKFLKPQVISETDTFLADLTSENPFWSKFAGKKPAKKKSVGQGSGRKRKAKK